MEMDATQIAKLSLFGESDIIQLKKASWMVFAQIRKKEDSKVATMETRLVGTDVQSIVRSRHAILA